MLRLFSINFDFALKKSKVKDVCDDSESGIDFPAYYGEKSLEHISGDNWYKIIQEQINFSLKK